MEVIIKGNNIDVKPDLEEYTERKLMKLTKLSSRLHTARVVFGKNASKKRENSFSVEVVVDTPGQTLKAEENDGSFFAAVDSVVDKLWRQLKKLKTKRQDKPRKKVSKVDAEKVAMEPETPEDIGIDAPPIHVQQFSAKPMSTAEAIMQLEVSGGKMVLFVNNQSQVNCIRKHPGGGYTLLVPEEDIK